MMSRRSCQLNAVVMMSDHSCQFTVAVMSNHSCPCYQWHSVVVMSGQVDWVWHFSPCRLQSQSGPPRQSPCVHALTAIKLLGPVSGWCLRPALTLVSWNHRLEFDQPQQTVIQMFWHFSRAGTFLRIPDLEMWPSCRLGCLCCWHDLIEPSHQDLKKTPGQVGILAPRHTWMVVVVLLTQPVYRKPGLHHWSSTYRHRHPLSEKGVPVLFN